MFVLGEQLWKLAITVVHHLNPLRQNTPGEQIIRSDENRRAARELVERVIGTADPIGMLPTSYPEAGSTAIASETGIVRPLHADFPAGYLQRFREAIHCRWRQYYTGNTIAGIASHANQREDIRRSQFQRSEPLSFPQRIFSIVFTASQKLLYKLCFFFSSWVRISVE